MISDLLATMPASIGVDAVLLLSAAGIVTMADLGRSVRPEAGW